MSQGTVDGSLELGYQLRCDLVHSFAQNVLRLGNEVESSHVQCLERSAGALVRMSAHHYDRDLLLAHDLPQSLNAIHPRHFKIQRDRVRFQLFNLLQGESAIHGSADNVNGIVTLQQLRNQLAHQGGVVHHEHANHLVGCCHDRTPTA